MNKVAEKENSGLVIIEDQKRQTSPHAPLPAAPANLMQALATAAANPAMDVAKVKELFAMHKELQDREAAQAFADAMARAQASIQPIAKDKRNDFTKSMYATLAAIVDNVTPIVTAEGLSVSYDTYSPKRDEDLPPLEAGKVRVVGFCSHRGGHIRKYHLDGALDDSGKDGTKNKTGIQAMGSTVSYLRRYLFCMIFNIATTDDNDGNGNGSEKKLDDDTYASYLKAIDGAKDEDELKLEYRAAYRAAEEVGDTQAMKSFIDHKDVRKKALAKK